MQVLIEISTQLNLISNYWAWHYSAQLVNPFSPIQVTSDGGGGLVSARDFIYVSLQGYDGRSFVMGGCSVEYRDGPAGGKIVRAVNGPGCQIVSPTQDSNKSHLVWLMDCDYKVTMGHIIYLFLQRGRAKSCIWLGDFYGSATNHLKVSFEVGRSLGCSQHKFQNKQIVVYQGPGWSQDNCTVTVGV